jgi:hypothetical protein
MGFATYSGHETGKMYQVYKSIQMGKGDPFEPLSLPILRGEINAHLTLPKEIPLGKPRTNKRRR